MKCTVYSKNFDRIRFLIIFIFVSIPLFVAGQNIYIVTDMDGFTNMREKPSVKSKIIDEAYQYEPVFSANYFCGSEDIHFENLSPNWIPIVKYSSESIGFVYKDKVCSLDEIENYRNNFNSEYSDTILCGKNNFKVGLILQPFDFTKYEIEYEDSENLVKGIISVDGEYPKALMMSVDPNKPTRDYSHKEIAALYIFHDGESYALPIDEIKYYFNPNGIGIYIVSENEFYIHLSCGDGGEAYSILLSVVDKKILYATPTGAC